MFKKILKSAAHGVNVSAAHGVNVAALCSMVAVGAVSWDTAQAEQTLKQFTEEQMLCLQQNIFFEARGESELGQRAIAWVTLNRVTDRRWSETVCEVVFENRSGQLGKCQFSWTCDGKPDYPNTEDPIEMAAWDRADALAQLVTRRWALGYADPTDGADHFHAATVRPYWASVGERTAQIDRHIFYRVAW